MLSEQTSSALYGKPLVNPSKLETELEKIRLAAEVQDTSKDQKAGVAPAPRARATLSNIIIVNAAAPGSQTDTSVDSLIQELCLSHPSRFFVVDCNLPPGSKLAADGMATAVSSRCFLADSGAHVCSEEVYVSVEERSVPLVPNLLVSLLAADVDVAVLLLGDPTTAPSATGVKALLSALAPVADRIIYDSASFEDCRTTLGCLSSTASNRTDAHPFGDEAAKFCDVTWQRIRRWRSLIAEGFDADRLSDSADSISRITITCQRDSEAIRHGRIPGDALFLGSWILSSLAVVKAGAASQTLGGVQFECKRGDNPLVLEFVGTIKPDFSAEKGTISVVEILSEKSGSVARLNIERRTARRTAEVSTGVTGTECSDSSCEFNVRNAPFLSQPFHDLVLGNVVSRRGEAYYLKTLEPAMRLASAASGKGAKA